jgi:hypothetical protein
MASGSHTVTEGGTWRLWVGGGALLLSIALPVCALLLSSFGFIVTKSAFVAFLLVGGLPEIWCLLAMAILGQDKKGFVRRPLERSRILAFLALPASRTRYYAGLLGCLLNGLPLALYAYAPWIMPDGANKYFILAASDLVFVYSAFLMGGEFWGKFRRLFVWEGLSESAPYSAG